MWSLWQLQLDDCEVGAFTGLLLTSPMRAGLSAPVAVAAIHRALGDALRVAVTARALNPGFVEARLQTMVQLAGRARTLGVRHPLAMAWCRDNWNRLELPALFLEIFDIPKTKEEATEAKEVLVVQNGPDPLGDYDPSI